MHVMFAGAESSLGRTLAQRLRALGALLGRPITQLTVIGEGGRWLSRNQRVSTLDARLSDAKLLQHIASHEVDLFFHLFSCTTGVSEVDDDVTYANVAIIDGV